MQSFVRVFFWCFLAGLVSFFLKHFDEFNKGKS